MAKAPRLVKPPRIIPRGGIITYPTICFPGPRGIIWGGELLPAEGIPKILLRRFAPDTVFFHLKGAQGHPHALINLLGTAKNAFPVR